MPKSYKWFALAAAQGDKDAGRKRDELATQLDAQTLAATQQAVKNYTAQPQPAEAIAIPEPSGGWDRTPAAAEKPRAGAPASDRRLQLRETVNCGGPDASGRDHRRIHPLKLT